MGSTLMAPISENTMDATEEAITTELSKKIPLTKRWGRMTFEEQEITLENTLRLLAATEETFHSTIEDIALTKNDSVGVYGAHYRRIVRGAIGVCARLSRIPPQIIVYAANNKIAGSFITDAATWALRAGAKDCQPFIIKLFTAYSKQQKPDKARTKELMKRVKMAPITKQLENLNNNFNCPNTPLFNTSKGSHQDISTRYRLKLIKDER